MSQRTKEEMRLDAQIRRAARGGGSADDLRAAVEEMRVERKIRDLIAAAPEMTDERRVRVARILFGASTVEKP